MAGCWDLVGKRSRSLDWLLRFGSRLERGFPLMLGICLCFSSRFSTELTLLMACLLGLGCIATIWSHKPYSGIGWSFYRLRGLPETHD